MLKVLLLDNYDSFTFNLAHILKASGAAVQVARNDKIELAQVANFDKIVLSPGPGLPEQAGIMLGLIAAFHTSKSILGICLGHQAIAQVFGAELRNLKQVVHGKATLTQIVSEHDTLFKDIPRHIETGRYHSWVVDQSSLPECLRITALSNDGEIMALAHTSYDLKGLQFHPESVLTPHGTALLNNWIKY